MPYARPLFANAAESTISSALAASSGATTIALTSGGGAKFPAITVLGDYYVLSLVNSSDQSELVKVTARSGDTLTVVRGHEGTTLRAFAVNDTIAMAPTAGTIQGLASSDGWTRELNAVAYASGTTFTVGGDQTGTYIMGRAVRLTQTTNATGFVASSVYGASTTVTVSGVTVDSGLAGVDYGISPLSWAIVSTFLRTLLDDPDAATARATLGLTIGTHVQAYDAELAALAGLTSAVNSFPYFSGSGTAALLVIVSAIRTLLSSTDLATFRSNAGLAIGTHVQAFDATLAALATLPTAADKLIYATGSDTFSTCDFPAQARTLLATTTAAAQRTALGLTLGTDVQEFDATLAALAALTTAADKLIYATGSDTFSTCAFPDAARTLLAATTAALQRSALELGSAALLDAEGIPTADTVVLKTSSTGAAIIPTGTTAQRPASPDAGMIRMNTTTGEPEWYNPEVGTWKRFADRSQYPVEFLVVGGGGGGGSKGGGGAGGYTTTTTTVIAGSSFGVTIGAGGAGSSSVNVSGSNGGVSGIAGIIDAVGGGGGGSFSNAGATTGKNGGSGGGGGGADSGQPTPLGGSGTAGQGNNGGNGSSLNTNNSGGGGGGAGAAGGNASGSSPGGGGVGRTDTWTGTTRYLAGGGGGGSNGGGLGGGGLGGGGAGANGGVCGAGGANTGGGGGASGATTGGGGGSGILVLRYLGGQRGTGGSVSSSGGYTIHTFASSGTYTA